MPKEFQVMALVLLPVGATEVDGMATIPGSKVVHTNVTADERIVVSAERLGRRLLEQVSARSNPDPIVLIFAGGIGLARVIAEERKLAKGAWRYATRLEDLRGYRGPDSCVVLIGASAYPTEPIMARIREAELTYEHVDGH